MTPINTKSYISQYHKNIIDKYCIMVCNYINLPKINIKYKTNYNNCYHDGNENIIVMGDYKYRDLNFLNKDIGIYLNKITKKILIYKILFVFFHEIGHYIQFMKYKKWFIKYKLILENDRDNLSQRQYEKYILEKNANKIALILMKKFCPEGLTNLDNMVYLNHQN